MFMGASSHWDGAHTSRSLDTSLNLDILADDVAPVAVFCHYELVGHGRTVSTVNESVHAEDVFCCNFSV